MFEDSSVCKSDEVLLCQCIVYALQLAFERMVSARDQAVYERLSKVLSIRSKARAQSSITMLRIGIGNDTHRLVEGRPLMLGGVQIGSDRGAEGHSDADALAPRDRRRDSRRALRRRSSAFTFLTTIRNGEARTVWNCSRA